MRKADWHSLYASPSAEVSTDKDYRCLQWQRLWMSTVAERAGGICNDKGCRGSPNHFSTKRDPFWY